MALCGEGAICIWNDITQEGEAEFYAWHIAEHMPERVGIPGFRRGRRYAAADDATRPRFFTLYETASPEVMVGQDYLNRLNAPTAWTKSATQGFRNTFRALTTVKASFGPGPGGALATLRFNVPDDRAAAVEQALAVEILPRLARRAQVTGAHLCMTNMAASAGRTAENRDRADIETPPNAAVLIEGCQPDAVRRAAESVMGGATLAGCTAVTLGVYRLEYERLKTAHSPC